MKKLLLTLIAFGLISPLTVEAAPRKKGGRRGSGARNALASRQRQAAASVVNCFSVYDELMEQGEQKAALTRLADVVVLAAQQAYGNAPKLPDHRAYVGLILNEMDQEVFDELIKLSQVFLDIDNKEEVLAVANKVMGSILLLINYDRNDDKALQRLTAAQQFLAKSVAYQSDPAMQTLLANVENQLGKPFADAGDTEAAQCYWQDAVAHGNREAGESLNQMRLAAAQDEIIEERDRQARQEGDVEAFEFTSRYYLEQRKRGIDNFGKLISLVYETIDRWVASGEHCHVNLERALPTLREMTAMEKKCEDLLLISLTMLGGYYERQQNYLKAAQFYQEILEVSPEHDCVANIAGLYFEGKLALKGKASWRQGIEILDLAAQKNNVNAALILAAMYEEGFTFACGGALKANPRKAAEYKALVERNQGVAISRTIIAALDGDNANDQTAVGSAGTTSTDPIALVNRGAATLARGELQAGLDLLEQCYLAGVLNSPQGLETFCVAMLTDGLDENLTKAQNSQDIKVALQALSLRTIFLGKQFDSSEREEAKKDILMQMIICMTLATKKVSAVGTDGLTPVIYPHAHASLSNCYRFVASASIQGALKQLFVRYQKELAEAYRASTASGDGDGKAEA